MAVHRLACNGAGEAGVALATAVAAGLVVAYAELRQLQFLLQSLLDALKAQHPGASAHVICTPHFTAMLHKVTTQFLACPFGLICFRVLYGVVAG